jgi:hypothetical protein
VPTLAQVPQNAYRFLFLRRSCRLQDVKYEFDLDEKDANEAMRAANLILRAGYIGGRDCAAGARCLFGLGRSDLPPG